LPFAALASQKNHVSLYLMGLYTGSSCDKEPGEVRWFRDAWEKSGKKKLDMGKSCIRFKKLDEVPLDVVGEAIRRMPAQLYIERYKAGLAAANTGNRQRRKS
jgi:hypothetical protein